MAETLRIDQFPEDVINHSGYTVFAFWEDGVVRTGVGFELGCLAVSGTTGIVYQNTGTRTSASFVAIGGAGTITTPTGSPGTVTTVQGAFNELYQNEVTAQGFIPLPLPSWRAIASNDLPNIAGTPAGGIICLNSVPILKRENTSTDKALRIEWAATAVIELATMFQYPPDMDVTKTYKVNLSANMSGATDIPVVAVGVFEGIGDTNRGSNTAAVTGTPVATYSSTITPTTAGSTAAISLIPAAHGTDALKLHAAWITYSKKILTS